MHKAEEQKISTEVEKTTTDTTKIQCTEALLHVIQNANKFAAFISSLNAGSCDSERVLIDMFSLKEICRHGNKFQTLNLR